MKRRVAILGSTGSIGTQALDVIAAHPARFTVVGLAAGHQTSKLAEQLAAFPGALGACANDGPQGLLRIAVESQPDIVLAATDGFVAFEAVFAAVERGIHVAVANKELIVAAGELLLQSAARSGSTIVPVDSEHSAIFQCLVGEDAARVQRIILTASGGPFWRLPYHRIANATLEEALAHPTWRMGVKNTVDSATMMNKGLEVIEASRLFAMPADRIDILVHPQSIAHGMVVFTDGSVKIQATTPDMRLPIGYALAYPDRLVRDSQMDPLEAAGAHPQAAALRYEFERPDMERFPCVRLAYEALKAGGTAPAILSAANEVAVAAFVAGTIRFGQIAVVVEAVMAEVSAQTIDLEGVRRADALARESAQHVVAGLAERLEV